MEHNNSFSTFLYGSAWIKADFHLHTRKDKEFKYDGVQNDFISTYVQRLKLQQIQCGVITNHNKYDHEEFKALRKKALCEEIFLMPGVELSVGDGANGVHTLVVFSDEWITNGEDYITAFLHSYFTGKLPKDYEHENGRSQINILNTIKMLEGYNKDFFLIFAHVEQNNGLWAELDGGRLTELGKEILFDKHVLGFQKVRTDNVADKPCRCKVKNWLGNVYPAEVEGSDCKTIEGIGTGKPCYLKVGDFSYDAIKFALMDFTNRVNSEPSYAQHSHIESILFEGGLLNGTLIPFSSELNTLIGIRGSGKSAIIESIRYAMNIVFSEKVQDRKYKDDLIPYALKSGGKIILKAVDKHGFLYEIRRILNQQPEVFISNILQPGISIRETVIHRPLYFGQKDLSSSGEGFEKDLVEKLIGEKTAEIRIRIDAQKQKVREAALAMIKLSDIDDKIKENEDKRKDAEHKLGVFKKYGIEEKLQKQLDYDQDERVLKQSVLIAQEYITDTEAINSKYEDDLKNQLNYKSQQNIEFFERYFAVYNNLIQTMKKNKESVDAGKECIKMLTDLSYGFMQSKEGLKDEFAEIERKLAEELKSVGAQSVRPEEFKLVVQVLETTKRMLEELAKLKARENQTKTVFMTALSELDNLLHEEFKKTEQLLKKVNENHSALKIRIEYKGDKESFLRMFKSSFKGSGIRESMFEQLVKTHSDFGDIYKGAGEGSPADKTRTPIFNEYFFKNLPDLVSYQVANRYIIEYQGKELKNHSLGQRASALILFILSQGDNDVIIIDQPEDDLDNQTIYQDVIKMIRSIKCKTQFILATHNPNIPVLGDADQVLACSFTGDEVIVDTGSIDKANIQKSIVNVMEGGKEAINRRKEIYTLWTRQN